MNIPVKIQGKKGWRLVVPSPIPIRIVELPSIKALVESGKIVIACGGGGIPVVDDEDGLQGVDAVVDKDLAAERLGEGIDMEAFMCLTDIECAYTDYEDKLKRKPIGTITSREARQLVADGHFGAGSMRPKIEACLRFTDATGHPAFITSLGNAYNALQGVGTFTKIVAR
eukprot:Colp12_sorted_trinity150504_noHs@9433